MKKFNFIKILIAFSGILALSSCEVIGGIFEAGIWVGVLIVVAIIILVIWLLRKMMK